MEIWPNFFIAGAGRAGTTSLYEYLKPIDDIFLSEIKEPNYFSVSIDPDILLTKPIRDKKKYLSLFRNVTNEIAIGEASPTYLWDPKTPKLIHETIPDAKFIVILRNPIERAYSHFLFLLSLGSESSDFSTAIKKSLKFRNDYRGRIIELGRYGEQLSRYLNIFRKEQIKIIIFEEFFKNPHINLKEVIQFLGTNYDVNKINIENQHNPFSIPKNKMAQNMMQSSTLRKIGKNLIPRKMLPKIKKLLDKQVSKPPMSENDRLTLEDIYYDDIRNLEKIMGRTLSWNITSK